MKIQSRSRGLSRYAFMTNFKRIAFYILYIALWIAGYEFYLMYPINKPFAWWLILIFAALVLISGWFIFKMTDFVRERSLTGRIKSMSISRTYGRGVTREGRFKIDFHTYRILNVTDEKGRLRKLKFQLFDDGYDLYYREGGEIAYFRGTKYPVCFDADEKSGDICVACGVRNYPEIRDGRRSERPTHCASCGKSLIIVAELKKQIFEKEEER